MIEVTRLKKYFPVVSGVRALFSRSLDRYVKAVDSISFNIPPGRVLGLVGESGCGKTTTGRVLVGLEEPTSGDVFIDGQDIRVLKGQDRKGFYRNVQMIFQDPYGSINPQHNVAQIISRPLRYQGLRDRKTIRDRTIETLESVGLSPPEAFLTRYPHLLSGGQRQRLCIGRAIVLAPRFIVADEPISMLDVSIKAGILALLKNLVSRRSLSMLYITHDLATVGHICDEVAIMYLGRIVESGPVDEVLDHPLHPYTRALISAIPIPDPDVKRDELQIRGAIADSGNLSGGCRFSPRCLSSDLRCAEEEPELGQETGRHDAACHKVSRSDSNGRMSRPE